MIVLQIRVRMEERVLTVLTGTTALVRLDITVPTVEQVSFV